MKRLHTHLLERYAWYAAWHNAAHSSLLHVAVLTAVISAIVLGLQTPFEEYAQSQLAAVGAARSQAPFAKGQLLVQFAANVDDAGKEAVLKGQGAKKLKELPQIRTHVISVPEGAEEKVRAALAHNPRVSIVELNYLAQSTLIPDDTYYANQWHSVKIGAPEGWDTTVGSSSVIVAVADSGFLPIGDLAESLVTGYDVVTNSTTVVTNACSHGASVAGTIGSKGNNKSGVAGLAWGTKIMPLAMADGSCWATYSNMAEAIIYAADHGAKVINISYGGTSPSSTIDSAVTYAMNKGAIFFASSGNDSAATVSYPAASPNAIAVGATGGTDARMSWSNYGSALDLVAPGSGIWTGTNAGTYLGKSGTSFAAPLAAGLAALVYSVNPNLTVAQVRDVIQKNADDLGTPGWDQYYGWGRINVPRTLAAAKAIAPTADTKAPTASIAAPASGATVTADVTVTVNASDTVGVSRVELFKDNKLFGTASTPPFSFFWGAAAETVGSHTLQAKAYDAAGNVGTSGLVSVTVARAPEVGSTTDLVAPTVKITSPANGARVKGKGSVTVSVTASDPSGISSIAVMADGATIGSCANVATCSVTWSGKLITAGTHIITAKAIDASANRNEASVSVTIRK